MTKLTDSNDLYQGTSLARGRLPLPPLVIEGFAELRESFDRLCLRAGTAAIETLLLGDTEELCGRRYGRGAHRRGHRWGRTRSEAGAAAG